MAQDTCPFRLVLLDAWAAVSGCGTFWRMYNVTCMAMGVLVAS
jgi:hypothetical protein